MLVAELLGTAVLATVAINVSRSQIGIGYFVAIAVGLALTFLVLALGPTSGGHFNPAVTIGLWTVRKVSTIKAVAYIVMQMLGGLAAWKLAEYFIGSDLRSIANPEHDWRVAVAELIGAAVFTFVIAAAVYLKYEGGKAAALIGGGLFMGVVVASLGSNAIINPAIALANQSWSLAYVIGPIIGGIIGMNLYVLLFAPVSALVLPTKKTAPVVVKAPAKTTTTSTAKVVKKAPAKKKPAARKKK
jgi:glycerol uptake facilitator-like aquaporin